MRLKLDQLVAVKVNPLEHFHVLGELGQVDLVVEELRLEVLQLVVADGDSDQNDPEKS